MDPRAILTRDPPEAPGAREAASPAHYDVTITRLLFFQLNFFCPLGLISVSVEPPGEALSIERLFSQKHPELNVFESIFFSKIRQPPRALFVLVFCKL
jgi:hypothetical protein